MQAFDGMHGYVWSSDVENSNYTIALKCDVELCQVLASFDKTSNEIPIIFSDEGFGCYNTWDYTDVYVGDACRVPACQYSVIDIRFDSEKNATTMN